VNPEKSTSRNIAGDFGSRSPREVCCFLLGAGRFALRHRFSFIDALYCCLAVVPAASLLLVFDYVFHHARLVSILLFFLAGILVVSSPVFDVALGVALIGAIAGARFEGVERRKALARITRTSGVANKEGP